MSNQSRISVTLSNVATYIANEVQYSFEQGIIPKPIMMHSSPGCGKSQLVFQTAEKLRPMFAKHFPDKEFTVIDMRAGAMDASDIQGVPFPVTVGQDDDGVDIKDLNYSTPQWFPRKNQCGILFLDELSNAAIPNQQALYRVILDRQIHNGKTMPNSFIIIGAGNNKDDKTGAKSLIPALASRFGTHFYIEPSVEEFLSYGMKKGFNEYIMGHIAHEKQSALVGKMNASEYGFKNPRNWESASHIMNNPFHTDQTKKDAVAGVVGRDSQIALYAHIDYYQFMPNFDDVAKGKDFELHQEIESDMGAKFALMMATTTRVCKAVREKEFKVADNYSRLIYSKLDTATASLAMRVMKGMDEEILATIVFAEDKMPVLAKQFNDAVELTHN